MADINLKDEDITIDMEQLTIAEYRKFAAGSMLESEDDVLLAKAIGKPVEWVKNLSLPDYRRLLRAFFDAARKPLSDPN